MPPMLRFARGVADVVERRRVRVVARRAYIVDDSSICGSVGKMAGRLMVLC